jgi:hypothetical protein
MKRNGWIYFILGIGLASACMGSPKTQIKRQINTRHTAADSLAVERILNNPNNSFLDIATHFIGTPYVAHSLECDSSELLTIALNGFDCTTFVETCMALRSAQQSSMPSFAEFANRLREIRYRNGEIKSYTSRLHYVTEWIAENEQNGQIEDLTSKLNGRVRSDSIHFMSRNSNRYTQLAKNPEFVSEIQQIESKLNQLERRFIPKSEVAELESQLTEGLIIAITTDIKGLDFVHMGISIKVNGRIHLLHASSDTGKVVVSESPLADYLAANKRQNGIVVLKLKP